MQNMDFDLICQRAFKELESSLDPTREIDVYETLLKSISVVKATLDNYKLQYQNAIDCVDQLIQDQIPDYLAKSFIIDQQSLNDDNDMVLKRNLGVSNQTQAWFAHRLHLLSSWQTPALIFRPSTIWFNDLVSNDPLYIADKNYELLKPCQQGYHEVYKRRLREYIINESEENFLTRQLPLEQFGLVFAWNYFELRTVDVLNKYVKEIAPLLRPGGNFVFTYNNCDHEYGIRLIHNHSGTYINYNQVKEMADKNNLIVSQYKSILNIAWVELKRPGEFASLRGGQSLAKIIEESK
jgi:hypothetical protein